MHKAGHSMYKSSCHRKSMVSAFAYGCKTCLELLARAGLRTAATSAAHHPGTRTTRHAYRFTLSTPWSCMHGKLGVPIRTLLFTAGHSNTALRSLRQSAQQVPPVTQALVGQGKHTGLKVSTLWSLHAWKAWGAHKNNAFYNPKSTARYVQY